MRPLGEHRCAEQQDVGPDDRFYCIKNVRVARQLNDPGCRDVGFDLELLLAFFTENFVIAVELRNAGCGLLTVDCTEGECIALPTKMLHLCLAETTCHLNLVLTHICSSAPVNSTACRGAELAGLDHYPFAILNWSQ